MNIDLALNESSNENIIDIKLAENNEENGTINLIQEETDQVIDEISPCLIGIEKCLDLKNLCTKIIQEKNDSSSYNVNN